MTAVALRFEKLSTEGFEALSSAHPAVLIPLEQTPQWAAFESSRGRTPYGIWAYYDGVTLVAVASYLWSSRRFRKSLVAVNGPVWFTERTSDTEARLLQTVREQFGADPAVKPLYVRLQVQHLQDPATGPIEHGWYEREIVVDLTPSEADIYKAFKPNARNSIRRAERAGVEIRSIERADWSAVFSSELFPILEETAARDGFTSFESAYYEQLLEQLGDHLRLMVAYLDGQAISWLITTEYRGYSVYYFAASTQAARKLFAPYLLLWHAFKELKAAGNRSCGLTGIVSENYPQLSNVTTFKRNFSKNIVDVPTTYDVPLDPLRYRAVALALKARRTLPLAVRSLTASAKTRTGSLLRRRPSDD
ncbi:peptidoglycan bridge formation glycyltransferase FemA/FemB family protein [Arthrobacter sp. Bz4]|uniref:lipid II:glycine glycyltransferase FemX n=1 Tax=Arthrobacter sp. Bz4 TaxID=2171979 RepID=UPI000D514E0D|nr:peptidoglycan bridge formation glycyltransferase FemA/FemB family protein [Arthrobacter sp. Bz4]PVE19721.1 hypothetical protein DDA93_02950 [Arthrobacter sp. Bz4]